MKFLKIGGLLSVLGLFLPHIGLGGAFQNLDFESSLVQPTAPGTFGTYEPIGTAMPGWRAFVGSTEISQVLHNSYTLGEAAVSLIGPHSGTAMEGNYFALLQPGYSPYSQGHVEVSLEQTGLVSNEDAFVILQCRYIRVPLSDPATHFGVYFNGQRIQMTETHAGDLYSTFVGDISSFRNQEVNLNVTAFYDAVGNPIWLDSIDLSPIPEPNTWSILILSALSAPFMWGKSRRTQ